MKAFVFTFLSLLFFKFALFSSLFADTNEDLTPLVGDLLKENFRVREQVKLTLDGSEAASGISRTSQITNEVLYISPQRWRVRRQLPFTEQSFEFLLTAQGVRFMSPFNRGVEPPFDVEAKTYLEILISPLRFARAWSMDGGSNMDQLVKTLRRSALTNSDGDRMELEEKDGLTTLRLAGKIVHDGKTRVAVESTWQILDRGKVQDAQMEKSLMRSF